MAALFSNGHKFGYHGNHWKGGRLTKEQYEALKGLVPSAIRVWKTILEMEVKIKGMSVQAETAAKVLNKFIPELIENESNVKYEAGAELAGLLRDVADRIAKTSQDNGATSGDTSEEGNVQGKD